MHYAQSLDFAAFGWDSLCLLPVHEGTCYGSLCQDSAAYGCSGWHSHAAAVGPRPSSLTSLEHDSALALVLFSGRSFHCPDSLHSYCSWGTLQLQEAPDRRAEVVGDSSGANSLHAGSDLLP